MKNNQSKQNQKNKNCGKGCGKGCSNKGENHDYGDSNNENE